MIYHLPETNSFIYPSVLRVISAIGDLGIGRKVHGRILKCGFESDSIVETALLSMYGELGWTRCARKVFDEMSVRDVVSWSSVVLSYVRNGQAKEGLEMFGNLVKEGVEIDSVALLSAVETCGELGVWRIGKSVHGYILRKSIQIDGSLTNSLVAMYGKCGDTCSAELLFDNVVDKNMARKGILPDSYTLASVLSASGDIGFSEFGCQIHSRIIRTGISTEFVKNSLIDMYSKCGLVDYALMIFKDTQERSVVTWNSMMCGLTQNGLSREAIGLFDEIYSKLSEMDEVTFLAVIQACSTIGWLEKGKWVHHKLIIFGVRQDMYVDTALTDIQVAIFSWIEQKLDAEPIFLLQPALPFRQHYEAHKSSEAESRKMRNGTKCIFYPTPECIRRKWRPKRRIHNPYSDAACHRAFHSTLSIEKT
ncbi:hypothetical protein K7X08_021226 [Anisodus acutangulus]|uniref:Pentatricopeptide repeat-containing protein n=1 Tax=Anisodus acutangulus TaxID=402998 RepID=A0A9Q1LYZ8_9SOLA|nr:hypothetical protein K7X08_021226 [Anisodus acutangulus]